ncbi:proton-translocating transhydrogenase family protein [Flavobacteriaceae bacterium F08102]|nr:proton-translocating transhydrogenase family protein [Flavobacteriaceae bacterium F08102]
MEFLQHNLELIYFVIFCVFIGIEVIANVPAILHTPLMSGANAISGVIMVGAVIMLMQIPPTNYVLLGLGGVAVFLGALNISGGFFVTGRMLKMFNSKK